MNEVALWTLKSHGFVVEYLEESDFLSVLKEDANPDTLNLPTTHKHCVIRYTHTPLEAVGYFATAASAWLPNVMAALKHEQRPEIREGVAEFFETYLNQENKRLLKLLTRQEAEKSVEVSEKDFRTSQQHCNR